MKILLMGDASNYHYCLSQGLAAMGHDVTVASNGSGWMNTVRNINLRRRTGKIGGAWLWLKLNTLLASDMRGYDVVQLVGPCFIDLRPHRIRHVFDNLRKHNGSVFMSALMTDPVYVKMCLDNKLLRYNEWMEYGRETEYTRANRKLLNGWLSPELTEFCRHVYENIDGAVSALYEYHLALRTVLPPEKVAYAGIPVDIPPRSEQIADGPLRVLLACHRGRELEKGVDKMYPVLQRLVVDNGPKVHFDFVQNVPFAQFTKLLSKAHVVVDQLYSYTPATTALMAMARGKVVVSGGEPEYYDFINEKQLHPIINPDPAEVDTIYSSLQHLVDDRAALADIGRDSRHFVIKHNSRDEVARIFEKFWISRLDN